MNTGPHVNYKKFLNIPNGEDSMKLLIGQKILVKIAKIVYPTILPTLAKWLASAQKQKEKFQTSPNQDMRAT